MSVTNQVGINNGFVTGTLGGSVSALSGTPAYYASQYPFYKFTSATSIC